jgi:hypothetical protein
MKHSYPAIFYKEGDGRCSVLFPDFDVATCGDDLDDAVDMAEECLALQLKGLRQDGDYFPTPSPLDKIDPAAYVNDLGDSVPYIHDSVPYIHDSVPYIRDSVPYIRLISVDLNDYN